MGKLLPNYKKSVVDDIIGGISANTSQYYAFASNPITYSGNVPVVTSDDYSSSFTEDWQMLFGKKLANTDIIHVINNIQYTTNTVYTRYDNTKDISNTSFYVIVPPSLTGGAYNVFKCIDNNNGANSTVTPNQIQTTSFSTADGYTWRYITSISSSNYSKFATTSYVPIYPNSAMVSAAANNSSVEVVKITNAGSNYISYKSGTVQSVVNSTLIQIESNASTDNNFYTKNGIFLYNTSINNPGVFTVSSYISNGTGKWVYLDSAANTSLIVASQTQYIISPKVIFETDGKTDPIGYSVVNTSTNSISSVVILDKGTNISWANVSIVSNTNYGSGAAAYAIVPPPGGHGSSPASELFTQGFAVAFKFANTESNTINTSTLYNKIGILKNPYGIYANAAKSSTQLGSNTFNALTIANNVTGTVFANGTTVIGNTSLARGTVVYSNTTMIYLSGDKYFTNNENVSTANGLSTTQIKINTNGDIYTKDILPLYIQNIDDVTRSNTQTESFKLIIQV